MLWFRFAFNFPIGSERGEPRTGAARSGAPQKVLPIETPDLSLNVLNRLTDNFGTKALIGEGSYGRVFYAKLNNGQRAAIKKLDTSSSPEPDSDFAAQVSILERKFFSIKNKSKLKWSNFPLMQLSTVSRLKNEHFVGLLGYCLEGNNRILAYEYATLGSLHDVLHGRPL